MASVTDFYTYDGNGNITKIVESDTAAPGGTTKTITYQYDELNQLIRENSQVLGKTITYDYDLGGNLVSVKEYAYTTAASITGTPTKTETGTYDTVWKDKLLSWGGTSMTYDAIGNMLTKGTTKYTWTRDRKLSAVDNGKKIQYFYDHTGNRTKKVVDGVITQFRMAGDLLVSERTGTEKSLWYRYDSSGNVISVTYDSTLYIYVRNAQNDIVTLVDPKGNEVVRYTYDSWGKVISITGSMAETLGKRNPFRYRGYYYDTETGMYYLKSRYYDPELRRFINADTIISGPQDGANLFAYCENNPVNMADYNGHVAMMLLGVGSLFLSTVVAYSLQKSYQKAENAAYSLIGGIAKPKNPWDILEPVNLQEAAKNRIDESFAKVKILPKYNRKKELHHIVAKRAWRAEPARAVLQSAGLTPEYHENLIYLKTGLHRRLHNTLYYEWINYEMESISVMFDEGTLKENKAKVDLKLNEIRVVLEGWDASSPF